MNSFQQQVELARQQVAKTGFSGTAVVDAHIYKGFIRQKIEINPPEKLAEFMANYTDTLVMILAMMNIQAKVHIDKD